MPLYTSQATVSFYENMAPFVGSQTITFSGSTHLVFPFQVDMPVSGAYLRIPASYPAMTSSTMATANASATGGISRYATYNLLLYTRGVGANSLSLQSVTSTTGGFTIGLSYSITGGGTQASSTYGCSFDQAGVATNTTFGSSESTDSYRQYVSFFSQFSGNRYLDYPFAYSLSPGQYWIGLVNSTSSTTSGLTTVGLSNWSWPAENAISYYFVSQVNTAFLIQGSTSNSSMQMQPGLGSWSTNSIGRTTASYQFAAISTSASHLRPYFQIGRTA